MTLTSCSNQVCHLPLSGLEPDWCLEPTYLPTYLLALCQTIIRLSQNVSKMKLSNCHNGPNGSHSLTFWISFLIPIAPTTTIHPTSLVSLWGNCRHLAGPRFLQRPAVLMEGEKNLAFKMIAIPGCTIMGSKVIKVGDKVTQLIFLRGGRVFTSMIGRFDQQNRNRAQCWASKRHKAPKGPKVGRPFLGSKYHVARSKNHVACQTLPNAIQVYAKLLQFFSLWTGQILSHNPITICSW